ncbi:heme exporter protein CcmD [Paraferrimonas sp. SM1919]|uniref:heme exporter protein CcmD n=1 Tax=Paraferrimonas sp. SM1919 TaxID=2662263 RepID=UPI0013D298A8|nr:heme exporter protein CcmD [Paraferrimonas sp. SM1919]
MAFESFSDFIAMGGYAAYVWSAFGISAALIIVLIGHSVTQKKRTLVAIAKKQQQQQKLKAFREKKNES